MNETIQQLHRLLTAAGEPTVHQHPVDPQCEDPIVARVRRLIATKEKLAKDKLRLEKLLETALEDLKHFQDLG